MPYPDSAKFWGPAEDTALIDELGRGRSVEAIAVTLKCSASDVRARLDALANPASADSSNVLFPKNLAAT